MLRFFKGLFQKQAEKVKIEEKELLEWFTNKAKPIEELLLEDLRIHSQEIRQKMNIVSSALDELENAELQNPNIPMRAKQVMEGNRKAYRTRMNNFLQNIKLPTKLEDIEENSKAFQEQIGFLAKSTAKEYLVLQEFFSNESRKVGQNIKEIENLNEKIRQLADNEKLTSIKEIKKLIEELKEKRSTKKTAEDSLEKKNQEVKDMKKVKEENLEKIETLLKDKDFKELEELKENRKLFILKLKNKAAEILHLFTIIDKALRKYIRISYSDQKILGSYLESPIKALSADVDFKIVDVLEKIKQAILTNKIELDSKKKEKTLNTIDVIDRDFLNKFHETYSQLKKEKEALDTKIDQITIEGKIEAHQKQVEEVKEFLKNLDIDISQLEEDIKNNDPEESLQKIIKEVQSLLNITLTVS
tara:strand:+ start:772 stop:2019 length:1248 start_codon:yes stop_codon:yes gene_type:complete